MYSRRHFPSTWKRVVGNASSHVRWRIERRTCAFRGMIPFHYGRRAAVRRPAIRPTSTRCRSRGPARFENFAKARPSGRSPRVHATLRLRPDADAAEPRRNSPHRRDFPQRRPRGRPGDLQRREQIAGSWPSRNRTQRTNLVLPRTVIAEARRVQTKLQCNARMEIAAVRCRLRWDQRLAARR